MLQVSSEELALPAEACEQSNQLIRGSHPGFGTSGCKAINRSWHLFDP